MVPVCVLQTSLNMLSLRNFIFQDNSAKDNKKEIPDVRSQNNDIYQNLILRSAIHHWYDISHLFTSFHDYVFCIASSSQARSYLRYFYSYFVSLIWMTYGFLYWFFLQNKFDSVNKFLHVVFCERGFLTE